eukprot:COSAG02_NODE_4251_length_5585_cov_4.672986_3_plen_90_part_00
MRTVEEARHDCNHANPLERTFHLDAVTPCPSPVLILECNLRVLNETLSLLLLPGIRGLMSGVNAGGGHDDVSQECIRDTYTCPPSFVSH